MTNVFPVRFTNANRVQENTANELPVVSEANLLQCGGDLTCHCAANWTDSLVVKRMFQSDARFLVHVFFVTRGQLCSSDWMLVCTQL